MDKYVITINYEGLKAGDEVSEAFALDQIARFKNPVVKLLVKETNTSLDVNNDGVVDKKDFKIMAKALGKRGGRPKKKR